MIRRFVRLIGFLLLAAGFVVAVIDGARWIGTHIFAPMSLMTVAQELAGVRFQQLERWAAPWLWQWVGQPFFSLPAFAVIFAAAFFLLWIARPPATLIGFQPRP